MRPSTTCTSCRSDTVVPLEWIEHDHESWWLLLRCGNCGARSEGVAHDREAERFADELDAGIAAVAADLQRLERRRMAAEAEALREAFARDLVDAVDFMR